MINPRINSGPYDEFKQIGCNGKQVKIQRPACWQSFTIAVNSVLAKTKKFYLIVEKAPFSLSLGSTAG